ncbi:MAG TPA: MarR family transcriptional regulator [Streptosporangiaceae bacterium]|jgi:DNA-binding MarR family transcriptional regulator|nr:MarR family transcriptional regulator [Streptosporangiaceae bacterium]
MDQRDESLLQIRAAVLTLFKLGRNRRRVARHNEVASRELRLRGIDASVSVSAPGYLILLGLGESEPCRVSDLARDTVQDLSAVVRQVQALEKAGLVARGSSPEDGRTVLITRTQAGKAALEVLETAATAQIGDTITDWTDAEVTQFARLFAMFVENSLKATYDA